MATGLTVRPTDLIVNVQLFVIFGLQVPITGLYSTVPHVKTFQRRKATLSFIWFFSLRFPPHDYPY